MLGIAQDHDHKLAKNVREIHDKVSQVNSMSDGFGQAKLHAGCA